MRDQRLLIDQLFDLNIENSGIVRMITLISVIHMIIILVIIGLVLVQDSKDGAMGGMMGGGGGSNSLLGATGAATLLEKLTVWFGVAFAVTCMVMTVITAQNQSSVVDTYHPPVSAPVAASAAAKSPTSPAAGQPAAAKAPPVALPATKSAPAKTPAGK